MEIKKTVTLNVLKKGQQIICFDLESLKLIVGTTSVSGNLHMFNIKKKGTRFIVSVSKIKERISMMENRKEKLERSLEIMKQVVK